MQKDNKHKDATPVATLCLTRSNGEMSVVQIRAGDSVSVGRIDTNEIVLAEVKVSRFHAVFSASTSGVVLSDLNSLNGTFINSRRLKLPQNLSSGDLVQIGDTKLIVQLTADSSPAEDYHNATHTQALQLQSVPVTVLLADVCNYTRLSETLPAVEVAAMLKRWCQMVSDIVLEHGGEVDKFIGDCVMSIWRGAEGAEGPEWGANQAARAAKQVFEKTAGLTTTGTWLYGAQHPWSCRQALNSGEALFGSVVDGSSREVSVLGDTVNVAFRLQDLASKMNEDILVSETTADYIAGRFTLTPLGSVPVEGKLEELNVFSLRFGD